MQVSLPASSSSKLLTTQRAANLAIRHLLPTAVGVSGSTQMIGLTNVSWSEDDAGDQRSEQVEDRQVAEWVPQLLPL